MKQSEGFTSKQRNYKRLLKEGETVTRSTDWKGNCYFDQLDQGDYEITEIKTASGQTLLKDPIKFSIPFKISEDEANDYQDITTNLQEKIRITQISGSSMNAAILLPIHQCLTCHIPEQQVHGIMDLLD